MNTLWNEIPKLDLLKDDTRNFDYVTGNIAILGVGGVGSNLVERLCIDGCNPFDSGASRLFLVDDDKIEFHNLNRSTLFKLSMLGRFKIHSLPRNSDKTVAINKKIFRPTAGVANPLYEFNSFRSKILIDCRDTLNPDAILDNTWLKLAYNGGDDLSFHHHPELYVNNYLRLDGDSSYDITPSFYVPASILANVALWMLKFNSLSKNKIGKEVQIKLSESMNHACISYEDLEKSFSEEETITVPQNWRT